MEIRAGEERYDLSLEPFEPSPADWTVERPGVRFSLVRESDGREWTIRVVAGRDPDGAFIPGWRRNYPPGGEAITESMPQYGGAVGLVEAMARADILEALISPSYVLVNSDGFALLVGDDRNDRRPLEGQDGRQLYVPMRPSDRTTLITFDER